MPVRYDREEVNVNHMRKMFSLAMVAILALTLALFVMGCGKKTEETSSSSSETTPPAETSTMPMDSTMHDSTGGAMADTTHHK